MKYKHLSQAESYQIYEFMIAGKDQTPIAKHLDRYKPSISRELNRNTGTLGYRPKQAFELSAESAQNSRNTPTVKPWGSSLFFAAVAMESGKNCTSSLNSLKLKMSLYMYLCLK